MSFIWYFLGEANNRDQKDNKWSPLFQYEADKKTELQLKEMFKKQFDDELPFVDNFLCAFKYWEELKRNMGTIKKDDLRAFPEDMKYKKCIKRIDKDSVYKTLKDTLTTEDYGIPSEWNKKFHFGLLDKFLKDRELKYYCPVKFHRAEDYQKLQECNFLFGFIPGEEELTEIINNMPQADPSRYTYSLVWKYLYLLMNPITDEVKIPNSDKVQTCLSKPSVIESQMCLIEYEKALAAQQVQQATSNSVTRSGNNESTQYHTEGYMYHQITSKVTIEDIKDFLCDPLQGTGMTFNLRGAETKNQRTRWFMMNCDAFKLEANEDEAD